MSEYLSKKAVFRGKRKDTGEWVYGYLIGKDVIVGEIVEFCDEYFNTEFWWRVDPETVGQSSGLTDWNDAEIFEGDIIKPIKNFRVFYVVERFRCGLICKRVGDPFVTLDLYNVRDNCIVIGNIHDHPHLLKGDENA